jgi:hypothetical protein
MTDRQPPPAAAPDEVGVPEATDTPVDTPAGPDGTADGSSDTGDPEPADDQDSRAQQDTEVVPRTTQVLDPRTAEERRLGADTLALDRRANAEGGKSDTVVIEDGVIPRRVRRPFDLVRLLTALLAMAVIVSVTYFLTATTSGVQLDPSMNVKIFSKILYTHCRTFNVPSWPSFTPWTIP